VSERVGYVVAGHIWDTRQRSDSVRKWVNQKEHPTEVDNTSDTNPDVNLSAAQYTLRTTHSSRRHCALPAANQILLPSKIHTHTYIHTYIHTHTHTNRPQNTISTTSQRARNDGLSKTPTFRSPQIVLFILRYVSICYTYMRGWTEKRRLLANTIRSENYRSSHRWSPFSSSHCVNSFSSVPMPPWPEKKPGGHSHIDNLATNRLNAINWFAYLQRYFINTEPLCRRTMIFHSRLDGYMDKQFPR